MLTETTMRRVLLVLMLVSAATCRRTTPVDLPQPSATAGASVAPSASVAVPVDDSPEAQALRRRLLAKVGLEVHDARVLAAMNDVPRHAFMPGYSLTEAYVDEPRPIGWEQTISQPSIVGIMTEALKLGGTERVLEIGTGSGYQAAVLARLAKDVYTIEILEPLAAMAKERLAGMGYANIHVRAGDGYLGWPEHAPFDRILVTAAPPAVPQALLDQLADGGILVVPVGPEHQDQRLLRYTKRAGKVSQEDLGAVIFVPMVKGR